jgi:hypothetical protein
VWATGGYYPKRNPLGVAFEALDGSIRVATCADKGIKIVDPVAGKLALAVEEGLEGM